MSFEKTLLLGAIAGFTIFLGLPLARLHSLGNRMRLAASMACLLYTSPSPRD